MALNDDKIKDLFSSKLNSFEPEVPASVWSGIDQLLSQAPPVQTPDASQATNVTSTVAKSAVLKTSLIAAGVAASVAAGVFLVFNSEDVEVNQIVEEVQPKEIIVVPPQEEIVEETTKVLAQADFAKPRSGPRAAMAAQATEVMEAYGAPKTEEKAEVKEIKVAEKKEVEELNEVEELAPLPLPKFLKKDISLGVRTNAGALSSDVNRSGGDLLFSKDDRSSEFTDVLRAENKDYELSHKQPISVGLTISKTLSRRLSVETGLMFTYLSSKINTNSAANIKEEQTFGYLGIPIYLNYNFLELEKAKFYISLGAMMQKDVYGRYTSKLITGKNVGVMSKTTIPNSVLYAEPAYMKKNISQSNWQFSSHLTVGAAYPIYNKLYIYTSIGGAYYFDADNEYRTIYSDREFQLDLNLGLRFDF